MIVVVEGVSAAGKTAWCARHPAVVSELPARMSPPSDDGPLAVARFWTEAQSRRWREAERLEAEQGVVYSDTDPLKLHYAWSMWQIGHHPREVWDAAVTATHEAIRERRLGFADRVVFLEPEMEIVRRQKEGDATRRRGNFELHLRLGPALRRWYELIEELRPGRVLWHGERWSAVEVETCAVDRFDLDLYEKLVTAAAGVQGTSHI